MTPRTYKAWSDKITALGRALAKATRKIKRLEGGRRHKAWAVVDRASKPFLVRFQQLPAQRLCYEHKGERVVPCTVVVGEKKERKG